MAEPLQCDRPAQANHAELYKQLVSELADFAVYLMDPKGCITTWNPGVERLLGFKEKDWIGQPSRIIFTPVDRAIKQAEKEMAAAVREGRAPDLRWHLRKDGSRLFVDGVLIALKDDEGQLLGFSKIMRDVTERARTEQALRESEERYRTLFNSIDQGFCILEIKDEPGEPLDYRFIEVNEAFERHTT